MTAERGAGRTALWGGAFLILAWAWAAASADGPGPADPRRTLLTPQELALGAHHTRHAEVVGKRASEYGVAVLRGVDAVQAHSPGGGGYFVGKTLRPPESPVGYPLALFGRPLILPTRTTSYCSGATYAAFVEALNLLYPDSAAKITPDRVEALRMQEPDGSTRADFVKVWGNWNSQWGHELALVSMTGMGEAVSPEQAKPGDFVNLAWKKGRGHAAVFLGWAERHGSLQMLFWSSQKHTHGYGDRLFPLSKVKEARFVRLAHPERVFTFDSEELGVRSEEIRGSAR